MPIVPRFDPAEGVIKALNFRQDQDRIAIAKQNAEQQAKQVFGENIIKVLELAQTNPKAARIAGGVFFNNAGLDKESTGTLLQIVDNIASREEGGLEAASTLVNKLVNDPNLDISQFPQALKEVAKNPLSVFTFVDSREKAKREAQEFQEKRTPILFPIGGGESRELPLTVARDFTGFLTDQKQLENLGTEQSLRELKQLNEAIEQGVPGAEELRKRTIEGRPLVNIQGPERRAQVNEVDLAFKRSGELADDKKRAVNDLAKINRIDSILKKAQREGKDITSIGSPELKIAGQVLDFFGLSTSDLNKFSTDVAEVQGLLASQVITAAGGDLGAHISDADRDTYAAQVGTARTPQEAIIELQKALKAMVNATNVSFNIANRSTDGQIDRVRNIQALDNFTNKISVPGAFIETDEGPQFEYFWNFAAGVLNKAPNVDPAKIIQLWNRAIIKEQ